MFSEVTAENTYALIVGIEQYKAGSEWNLNGPANDAIKFTHWLLDRGVKQENIWLFLSPLASNEDSYQQIAILYQPATREKISDAITYNLLNQNGDLLYVFWSGHGFITKTDQTKRRLFFSDSDYTNVRNLDFYSLREALKYSTQASGFREQVYLIDACADPMFTERFEILKAESAGERFSSSSDQQKNQQYTLYASLEYDVALNDNSTGTGVFFDAIWQELEKQDRNSLLPDMYQLANALDKKLEVSESDSGDGFTKIYRSKQSSNSGKRTSEEQKTDTSTPLPTLSTFKFQVVTVNSQGQIESDLNKQAKYFTENLGLGVSLEMVEIPGGENFLMGAPQDEKGSQEYERPQHRVNIKPFFIGRYPITQAQWRAIATLPKIKRNLDPKPSCFKGDNRPVERVSWHDVTEFCKRLSQKTRRFYRLPSEAEWEYACRAGTLTPFHFGEIITTELANYYGQDHEVEEHLYSGTYSDEPYGISHRQTTEVGRFPANDFGLYDMHGLVWEWCADYEHEDYHGAPIDGSAWVSKGNDEYRVLRGGSWNYSCNFCRSASRFSKNSAVTKKEFGFRVVCSFL